jgi:precorrin-6B methylase 2
MRLPRSGPIASSAEDDARLCALLDADPRAISETLSDADLSPDTLLQLAPNVRTRLDAGGHVLVDAPDGTIVDIGPRGYSILSLFSRPRALGEAIDRLEDGDRNTTDFAPALSVINMLMEDGALVRPGALGGVSSGWADPVEHARMLHDDRRTGDYLAALDQAVRPGDVVLDLGTGSGVLAIAAARAGARHVYAVEASDIADVAAGVFAANGLQDRITLVAGWSRQIELPERADLLVSEIIGNEPFEEELLETTLDARRRLLKPAARLIPNVLTLFARPLLLPEADARQRALGRDSLECWQALYGIDFEPLVDAVAPRPVNCPTEAEVAVNWPPVGPGAVLAVLDLAALDSATVRGSTDLPLDAPGPVNAVAVTFRAHLHGSVEHTLDPWRWPTSSWATSVWVFPDRVHVGADAALRVRYHRRISGVPDGLSCEVVDRVPHSHRVSSLLDDAECEERDEHRAGV